MTNKLHSLIHFIRHLFQAKRNGHGVHSPFAYQLCEEIFYNPNRFYDFRILGAVRNQLLASESEISIEDFGAGSRTFKSKQRKIKDIAEKGISSRQQSEMLYKLSNFLNCRTIVELGTSLGLNTLYLARVNAANEVISIDGSRELSAFAADLAARNKITNIRFVCATFERAFPEVLNGLQQLDLLYVDGNHTYEATMYHFEKALAKKHPASVFVFDDIYWSKGMTKAWREIIRHPSVTLSIDTFYSGLIFFRGELKEKVDLKFFI